MNRTFILGILATLLAGIISVAGAAEGTLSASPTEKSLENTDRTTPGDGATPSTEQLEKPSPVLEDCRSQDDSATWLPIINEEQTAEGNDDLTAVAMKVLEGRNYYFMGEGERCVANDPVRTRLKTWRSHVSFHENRVLIWGSICNDNPVSLSVAEVQGKVFISEDLSRVLHGKEILIFSPDPPKLCEAGIWCPEGEK